MTDLDPGATALVLIDLQNGILDLPLAPRSGRDVYSAAQALAERFRAADAPVLLVRVAFADDFSDAPRQKVDQPLSIQGWPPGWSELAEGLQRPGDIVVTKRQWGAFHGTDLDLQLRRRGIGTIVLGGVATNFGVESTARQAWEYGYDVVLAEDLCASRSSDLHDMAIHHIFPRIARVMCSADIELRCA